MIIRVTKSVEDWSGNTEDSEYQLEGWDQLKSFFGEIVINAEGTIRLLWKAFTRHGKPPTMIMDCGDERTTTYSFEYYERCEDDSPQMVD